MAEYFEDWRWTALKNRKVMKIYWDSMRRAGIDESDAEEFLNIVWRICAASQDMDFLRKARQEEKAEAAAYETLRRYHPDMPRPSSDELVMAATKSRKKNIALDCGRYLVAKANELFKDPIYPAVAQAVSVGLGLEEELDPENLKQSCYDMKNLGL